jgi:hypothetical protein
MIYSNRSRTFLQVYRRSILHCHLRRFNRPPQTPRTYTKRCTPCVPRRTRRTAPATQQTCAS